MMKMVSVFHSGRWGRGAFRRSGSQSRLSVVAASGLRSRPTSALQKSAALSVLLWILGLAPAPVAFAQELLPELAAPAAKHKATDEALDKQKLESIALAAKSYVSALDSIEKTATAKGEIDLVAAVVKEREAVASGALESNLPAALPKARLQMSRKTLLTSVERINADFAKRKKMADADYLRVLATFQTKAASNPELAKQFAAEKAALLEGGGVAGSRGGQTSKKVNPKNVVVNGDFEKVADGIPEGWQMSKKISVLTEKGSTFVRFDAKPAKDGSCARLVVEQKDIVVPPKAELCTISLRMRTANVPSPAKGKGGAFCPTFWLNFSDDKGTHLGRAAINWEGKNGSWRKLQREAAIPAGAVRAVAEPSNGSSPGQIDFDDIEVTFK